MSRNGGGGEVASLTLGFVIEFDNGINKPTSSFFWLDKYIIKIFGCILRIFGYKGCSG